MDEWGREPSVQRMRKVFSAMEEIDKALINKFDLSPFDERLRKIRETSLELFEKSYSTSLIKGYRHNESSTIELFKYCNITALKKYGISSTDSVVQIDNELVAIVKEALE